MGVPITILVKYVCPIIGILQKYSRRVGVATLYGFVLSGRSFLG
jgi:hypothetical protein